MHAMRRKILFISLRMRAYDSYIFGQQLVLGGVPLCR